MCCKIFIDDDNLDMFRRVTAFTLVIEASLWVFLPTWPIRNADYGESPLMASFVVFCDMPAEFN